VNTTIGLLFYISNTTLKRKILQNHCSCFNLLNSAFKIANSKGCVVTLKPS